jgi:hypothetical protein
MANAAATKEFQRRWAGCLPFFIRAIDAVTVSKPFCGIVIEA